VFLGPADDVIIVPGIFMSFAVPLLQRAFGLPEPFGDQLDAPPGSDLYEHEYQLRKPRCKQTKL